jgi:hypothetical protein
MDMVIGVVFVVFMFLVDWRLNRIYLALKQLNETLRPPQV